MKIKIAALCVLLSASGLNAFAETRQGDPSGRIARLNYMSGTVTTEPAGASDWSYAQSNRPLTTGDQLWNDENARSELHIGSTAVRLGSSTALSVLALDDNTAQLKIAQGTLSTRVRELPPGTTYEIGTPNTALAITTAGEMRVDVAPDGRATTVTVRSGGVTASPEAYRQARVEQPRHEMPPPHPQPEAQRPQPHQEPTRQPMHQEVRQAPPPQMQNREPHQPQQPQQQRGGGNEHHRG